MAETRGLRAPAQAVGVGAPQGHLATVKTAVTLLALGLVVVAAALMAGRARLAALEHQLPVALGVMEMAALVVVRRDRAVLVVVQEQTGAVAVADRLHLGATVALADSRLSTRLLRAVRLGRVGVGVVEEVTEALL